MERPVVCVDIGKLSAYLMERKRQVGDFPESGQALYELMVSLRGGYRLVPLREVEDGT
jgi:hypothetical protein